MLKTKQRRFAIVAVLLFSMISMYGGMPSVNAATMDNARTTLSDSEPAATDVTATVDFNLGTALTDGQYVSIGLSSFTGLAELNVDCPGTHTASTSGSNAVCIIDTSMDAVATNTIAISGLTNPSGQPASYAVDITSYTAVGVEIEQTRTMVYIIDAVVMTANVAASLTFAIHGTTTNAVINGDTTIGSSSANELAFGTITSTGGDAGSGEYRLGQHLEVSTNATAGFTVTVQQDGNMVNGGGADIDSFSTSTPAVWADPAGTLDLEYTYGHMGVASDDSDLTTSFTDGFYIGLNGTTPLEVMSHTGPADGETQDKGLARVMYNLQISDLQEAGDYENTLTYICTPTF